MRFRGKEAYVKDVSLRTGTWYKADGMVELAQHSEGRSSVLEVNHGVVHRKKASRSRKSYWRMSRNSLMSIALNNTYLAKQGVLSLRELWIRFKYGEQTKV